MSLKPRTEHPTSPAPFLLLTMPLSSHVWFANWLDVPHDKFIEHDCVEDFCRELARVPGFVEPKAVLGWKAIKKLLPRVRLAVVLREPNEIAQKFLDRGLDPPWKLLNETFLMLQAIAEVQGTIVMDYDARNSFTCMGVLWNCLRPEVEFDPARLDEFRERVFSHDALGQDRLMQENPKRLLTMCASVWKLQQGTPGWFN